MWSNLFVTCCIAIFRFYECIISQHYYVKLMNLGTYIPQYHMHRSHTTVQFQQNVMQHCGTFCSWFPAPFNVLMLVTCGNFVCGEGFAFLHIYLQDRQQTTVCILYLLFTLDYMYMGMIIFCSSSSPIFFNTL